MQREQLKEKYTGATAEKYEDRRRKSRKWHREQDAVNEIINLLVSKDEIKHVIDIPVGTGRFLELYDEMNLNSIGIDASEDMLEKARKKSTKAKLKKDNIFELETSSLEAELIVCVRFVNWISFEDLTKVINKFINISYKYIILGVRLYPSRYENKKLLKETPFVFKKSKRVIQLFEKSYRTIRKDGIKNFFDKLVGFFKNKRSRVNGGITIHQESNFLTCIEELDISINQKRLVDVGKNKEGEDISEYYIFLLEI